MNAGPATDVSPVPSSHSNARHGRTAEWSICKEDMEVDEHGVGAVQVTGMRWQIR